ncbi:MAG: hypothetical protein ACE10H_00400 [Candidatus Binatia bacterium]
MLIRAGDPKARAPGTAHEERARAEHAFAAREYMIVINDQRILDPEAVITLLPDTRVEFIKILPLVGG